MGENGYVSSLFSGRLFFRNCGIIGIVGSLIVVIADFVGIAVVDDYNPITQTISNLAIGKYGWIQDVGLNLYGVSLFVLAIALWRWDIGDWRWRLGAALVFLIGIDILVISEYDRYAGDPNSFGRTVHLYAVYVLGVLLPLVGVLCSFGLRRVGQKWQYISWAIAAIWIVCGPPFFQVPTNYDGLYERFVATILLCWTVVTSWLVFEHGGARINPGNL